MVSGNTPNRWTVGNYPAVAINKWLDRGAAKESIRQCDLLAVYFARGKSRLNVPGRVGMRGKSAAPCCVDDVFRKIRFPDVSAGHLKSIRNGCFRHACGSS